MQSSGHVVGAAGLLRAQAPEAAALMPNDADAARNARLERLVREHYDFVWRSARRLGVRSADLEDVVQEVFIVASARLDEITNEIGFLFRACKYASLNARRSVKRRREIVDDEQFERAADPQSPEQVAETAEARARLQAILEKMPTDLRVVFILFELERFTLPEIAQTLMVPLGTASSRLRRAREIFFARTARL